MRILQIPPQSHLNGESNDFSSAFRPTSTDPTSGFWSQKLPPGNKGSFVCGEVCLPLAVRLGALGGPWTWRHKKRCDAGGGLHQGIPKRNGRLVVLQNVPGQQALQRWEGHRWWKVRLPHLGLMLLGDGVCNGIPQFMAVSLKQRGGLHGHCKQGTLWYNLKIRGVLHSTKPFFSGSIRTKQRQISPGHFRSQQASQVSRRCDPSCDRKTRCCDTEKMARAAATENVACWFVSSLRRSTFTLCVYR